VIHSALLIALLPLHNPILAKSELENKVKVKFIFQKKRQRKELSKRELQL